MKYGSVCSGIEAATVAWHELGWQPVWFSEIEAFPSAVLAHHYPNVENLGDMTLIRDRIKTGEVFAPDVLVGGTPCQAFSVAGARQSLNDDRGQLTLEFVRLANEIDTARLTRGQQPSIIVWENVPGVLSTKDNAFGCFLGALCGEDGELQPSGQKWGNAGCVFGKQRTIAWRILDAQYFGVAQRRRRVFVVASARKDFNPTEVLFEFDGVRRDSAPCRSEGQEVAGSTKSSPYLASGKPCIGTLMANAGTKLWLGNQEAFSGDYAIIHSRSDYKDATDLVVDANDNQTFGIPGNWIGRKPENGGNATEPMDNISPCQTKTDRHAVAISIASKQQAMTCEDDLASTLGASDYKEPQAVLNESTVSFQQNAIGELRESDVGYTLNTNSNPSGRNCPMIRNDNLVRRLTPVECERLQGFPDNYTKIPYRNKLADQCPDGSRYAACGNSMAVPVMRWIGRRIQKYCGVISE